jgi:transposase
MAWLRIQLTEDEQRAVKADRESHPDPGVRRKFWVLWVLHCGALREKAAEIVGVSRATVERYVREYRAGGLDALRKRGREYQPTSELAAHADAIRLSFDQQPARTIAEACQRIEELTGVRRQPTQVRRFLKGLGLKWQRVRAIPVPPKKTWTNTPPTRPSFTTSN